MNKVRKENKEQLAQQVRLELPEKTVNPDPRETKENKAPRENRVELVSPVLLESREQREKPVPKDLKEHRVNNVLYWHIAFFLPRPYV